MSETKSQVRVGLQLVDRLLAKIVDGAYGDAGRLPSERELSVTLEASRASVREALQTLTQWGVIETKAGSGAVVKPVREWRLDVLPLYASQQGFGLSQGMQLIRDVMELRRGLYRDIAERAGVRGVHPRRLAPARDAVERAWACREDAARFGHLDLEVMRRVLEAAGMLPSLWMLNQLAGVYAPIMQSSATAIPVPESYREAHQNLFTALENRDSEAAKEAIDVYLAQMEAALLCRAA